MPADTTKKGLETLVVEAMTEKPAFSSVQVDIGKAPGEFCEGTGWVLGRSQDYNCEYAVDLVQLNAFLKSTQPGLVESLDLENSSPKRQKFLFHLQGEITKRGIIDVLLNGIIYSSHDIDLFYGTPTHGNTKYEELNALNRFSVSRHLGYSQDETKLALDLVLFINGLPIATFELKNNLTKQTVEDAVEHYKRGRDPKELIFQFGRCIVHFAVDDHEVKFCTQLNGKSSWFLPFNQGYNDGAGNPPNLNGIKTDYLWKRILTPKSLTNILENYAQVVKYKNKKTGEFDRKVQIFPRYHQLDIVRKLLAHAGQHGAGKRYLIQHSNGSGKCNSIAWLAYQLIGLKKDDKDIFDSIIVITNRHVLDKQFVQVSSIVGYTERSNELRRFIEGGKKIIISTVKKFQVILDEIGMDHNRREFAIIIDESQSNQGRRKSAAMNEARFDPEDTINGTLEKRMYTHKILSNVSYFVFTATPKNKTLELFGEPYEESGQVKYRPFHIYTMKQAIQEGFILDVLSSYTPVNSYYKLIKTVEKYPEFETKMTEKKLCNKVCKCVENHDNSIQLKAEIMVDHFHEHVIALNKIGGQARAMVVTDGVEQAIQYYYAIHDYLVERKSQYQAIVAFSGEREYGGVKVTEASINGFPSNQIEEKIKKDPYRFLICADKFQTDYEEPLLHTMYVDKVLSGIRAVQILSRLNQAHPKKHDVFVLDFMNNADTIQAAFSNYYRTTILSDETDPNKLHDLKADLDNYQVYAPEDLEQLVALYLSGSDRDKLDPILDTCVATYKEQLDEDGQVDFKGKAKAFNSTYDFLASILPYTDAEWEKLSIFLNFLVPKLPAPIEEDFSRGILEAIDIDSYRAEKQAVVKIRLPDLDAEIEPVPTNGHGFKPEPELDRLSNIIKSFNEQFGGISWTDSDRIIHLITEELPAAVLTDTAYQNAKKNSDKQNARIELDKAAQRAAIALMSVETEFFKQFSDNESFRRAVMDTLFSLTWDKSEKE